MKNKKKENEQDCLDTIEKCFSLNGKNVVIVGGGGKMSEAFSRILLSSGCSALVLSDVNKSRLKAIRVNLQGEFPGRSIHIKCCDISSEKEVNEFVEYLCKYIDSVDVLIYAVMSKPDKYYAPFTGYEMSTWDTVMKGNLSGAFVITQKLEHLMRPFSSIIFISSIYGIVAPDLRVYDNVKSNIYNKKYPLSTPAVYSASKAGLVGLAKYLAVYLADKDIRTNVLVPGGVYDNQDESFYDEYIKRVPLKRMAVWTDYNGAIVFLASDASRYMTGQLLVVDGGWSVW